MPVGLEDLGGRDAGRRVGEDAGALAGLGDGAGPEIERGVPDEGGGIRPGDGRTEEEGDGDALLHDAQGGLGLKREGDVGVRVVLADADDPGELAAGVAIEDGGGCGDVVPDLPALLRGGPVAGDELGVGEVVPVPPPAG